MVRRLLLSFFAFILIPSSSVLAQTTYFPARGVWNGFLGQLNIAECDNGNAEPVELTLTVTSSFGVELANVQVLVPASGSQHTILNDLAAIGDSHGTYRLSLNPLQASLGDKLSCRTVFYRPGGAASGKSFEYAYSLPVQNAQSGKLAGVYNSIDPAAGGSTTNNWLSIVNLDQNPFNATVSIYRADGTLDETQVVSQLAAGGRHDIPLGHPRGQVTGLYSIQPNDSAQLYDAVLVRYNQAPEGSFNFAFPLRGTNGSCTGNPVLASTMGNGLTRNWLEIANANDLDIQVTVEVRDQVGTLVYADRPVVPQRGQYHLYLSDKIDPLGIGGVGSARVLCDDPTDKLIIQSTFYGAVPGKAPIEWAYSTQELGRAPVRSDARVVAPVNTFVGMANWFKFADASLSPTLLSYSAFDQVGAVVAQGDQGLPAGGTADLGLHPLLGADRVGSVVVASGTSTSAYSGEMLRVLSRADGQIGNIISIPGVVQQNGLSGGSFRGDAQSLAKYRDHLSYREAQRLLSVTSFGGNHAEVLRAMQDGLESTVERLSTFVSEPSAVVAEAEDWIDGSFREEPDNDPNDFASQTGVKNWWLTYALKSPNPLKEKLALFWHDRFASSCRVLDQGRMMNKCKDHIELFRTHALGSYRALLRGMTVDFLMLKWLNGELNVRQRPDENYAREIMELFSLGEAQNYGAGLRYPLYTEAGEIKELARALTGYTTQFVNDQFGQEWVVTFVRTRHDDGAKTVWPGTPYERTGNFEPLDVPDLILTQRPRDVGRYLSGALFTTFCHDSPSEQLKAQMADILISSNWEIRPLVKAILKSEACFSTAAKNSRISDPLTFGLGLLKRTGIPMRADRLSNQLSVMGYDVTNPVDVFGWSIGYREKQHAETTYWNAFPVEFANFVTLALTSHRNDFRDPNTNLPLLDFCTLNPTVDANAPTAVDYFASLFGVFLTEAERTQYIRYLDNDVSRFTNGAPVEVPRPYNPTVRNVCEEKLGGLIWLLSLHPSAMTY